jgi:hypothetical protein
VSDASGGCQGEQTGAGADVQQAVAGAEPGQLEDAVAKRLEPGTVGQQLDIVDALIPVLLAQPARTSATPALRRTRDLV